MRNISILLTYITKKWGGSDPGSWALKYGILTIRVILLRTSEHKKKKKKHVSWSKVPERVSLRWAFKLYPQTFDRTSLRSNIRDISSGEGEIFFKKSCTDS